MNLAIIPARGGSKRIPRKNIKAFHGKPMIAYSLEAAFASKCFDKVIVSTDDSDIKDIALAFGAEVPFIRPSDISDDFATTNDVIKHAITFGNEQQWAINKVCCIYATAPFLKAQYIKEGLDALIDGNIDFAFSATSFPFPIQRAIRLLKNNRVEMFQPEHLNTRSQDLEEAYHDAGQFYWGKPASFLANKPFFSAHSKAILLPRKFVQDIDTPEDWELAEALFKAL
jgi:N-acylneuraminate cytidylyltransferase